uniref:Uncharacterized protein n=1 Tax=Periophthalmus magnuspinnatus TaxID=409849 RepID=A0A3B4B4X5_9GOBI
SQVYVGSLCHDPCRSCPFLALCPVPPVSEPGAGRRFWLLTHTPGANRQSAAPGEDNTQRQIVQVSLWYSLLGSIHVFFLFVFVKLDILLLTRLCSLDLLSSPASDPALICGYSPSRLRLYYSCSTLGPRHTPRSQLTV